MKHLILILLPFVLLGQVSRKVPFIQRYSNATVLNGSNQYWSKSSPDSITANAGQGLVVMAWINTPVVNTRQYIVARYKSVVGERSFILDMSQASDGKVGYIFSASGSGADWQRASSSAIVANRWYLVAGVYKPSTNCDIYINGVLDNGTLTGAIGGSVFNPATVPLTVGIYGDLSTAPFNGKIGEVQIVRFANGAIPSNIASIMLQAYNQRRFRTTYEGGEVVFHIRWDSWGDDNSIRNNNLTPSGTPIVVRVKQ